MLYDKPYYSIKIVGISGIGKTTLINAFCSQHPHVTAICYSKILSEHAEMADMVTHNLIRGSVGLLLMDEHLEINEADLTETYRSENTAGIFVLCADIEQIIARRKSDQNRYRSLNIRTISRAQTRSKKRSVNLAETLGIPICITFNDDFDSALFKLRSFINLCGITT